MKINFILPTVGMGGGIRVIGIHAKALTDMGHEIFLVSPPPQKMPYRRRIKSVITGQGWPASAQTRSHLDGLGLEHQVLDRWRPVTDADIPDADVVIATWWETAEWVNALSDRKGAKIYFIQGHEVHEHLPVERSRATYYLPLRKIVVSRWLQNIMRLEYGVTDVDVVPNSVDHKQFFSAERGKQAVPTVGFLYSQTKLKGVDVTVQAINRLRVEFPNLRVLAFGSDQPGEAEGFDSRIEFHYSPPQEKIRDLYAQCDVWISASRNEGFNLPAMEAMACRTPVVATRTGWPVESVVKGKNGVLVDIGDVDALARGVASVLHLTDEEWREMSKNACDTVAASSWHESTEKFEQALQRACR